MISMVRKLFRKFGFYFVSINITTILMFLPYFHQLCNEDVRIYRIITIISAINLIVYLLYKICVCIYPGKFSYGMPLEATLKIVDANKSIVYSNCTRKKNIKNMHSTDVERIIVQRTDKKGYFREIITGKVYSFLGDGVNKKAIGIGIPIGYIFPEVDSQTLKNYIEQSKNDKDFGTLYDKLNYYEEEAERCYLEASKNAILTDEAKVNKILSTLR